MSRQEQGEPPYPTTETGGRLWSNICTLLGVAWASRIDMRNSRERMVELIRRLEGVEEDKPAVAISAEETVDEQYARLHVESALPIAIDNGEEMIVASFGGKHDDGHPFPEHVTLLHRDANGNEIFGMYEFVAAESPRDKE